MRISFDLDGTAWSHPRFFIALAQALQAAGHEVGVLTIHDDSIRSADLKLWHARGFPPPDFFYNATDMTGVTGDVRERKLAFARRVNIDCHIDDFDDRHPNEIELVLLGVP